MYYLWTQVFGELDEPSLAFFTSMPESVTPALFSAGANADPHATRTVFCVKTAGQLEFDASASNVTPLASMDGVVIAPVSQIPAAAVTTATVAGGSAGEEKKELEAKDSLAVATALAQPLGARIRLHVVRLSDETPLPEGKTGGASLATGGLTLKHFERTAPISRRFQDFVARHRSALEHLRNDDDTLLST
jgi:hypothetical protein